MTVCLQFLFLHRGISRGLTHISLVNIDPGKTNLIRIQLQGATLKLVIAEFLQSARIQDHNSFDDPEKI